jgi:MoaA/NifB/PqqE/SkfB family radical SAM enzyme
MSGEIIVTPNELVFNVTYRCPLRCSHCCFSSDMDQHGHLDGALMAQAVSDAAAQENLERIDFVGGDPFLHPELIEQTLQRSKAHGIAASVTTSAYWATTPERALRALQPLAEAGLERIIISYDDMHAEYLPVKHVVNAYQAARRLDLDVYVAVVVVPGGTIDSAFIYRSLQLSPGLDPKLKVYETAVSSTGRANESADEETLAARRRAPNVYRGPCHSALRQFSITPAGKVLPCCGVLPFHDKMVVGDLAVEPVTDAMARAYDDAAMKWIAFEGPVALLRQITADTERPLRDEDFDGICHACDVLFSTEHLQRRLREYLPEKLPSLLMTEAILDSLGLYRRPGQAQKPAVLTERVCNVASEAAS